MSELAREIAAFGVALFHQLSSDSEYSFTLRRFHWRHMYNIELPEDFRLLEQLVGFVDVRHRDCVVFCGGPPCRVRDEAYWGYHEQPDGADDISEVIFLGYDAYGMHYGYDLRGGVPTLICWDYTWPSLRPVDGKTFFEVLRAYVLPSV